MINAKYGSQYMQYSYNVKNAMMHGTSHREQTHQVGRTRQPIYPWQRGKARVWIGLPVVGWLVGLLAGWLAGWLVGWLVGSVVGRLVFGWLALVLWLVLYRLSCSQFGWPKIAGSLH
jgi:hypothetical protein